MTLFLDSSALVGRYLSGPSRAVVLRAMRADREWCASALALTEALAIAERLADPGQATALRRALRDEWDCFWVVPVDQPCLDRAADLTRDHPLRTVDALHLAAADRLPRPATYLTFDAHQLAVAHALGFEVATATIGDRVAVTPAGRHPDGMID